MVAGWPHRSSSQDLACSAWSPDGGSPKGRRWQDKSRDVRGGWRGENSKEFKGRSRGAQSRHGLRADKIALAINESCTSRPSSP